MSTKPLVAITGASAGIGTACAKRFAQEGFRLAIIARRREKLLSLRKELDTEVGVFELDVRDKKEVMHIFQEMENAMGPVDVLINNAGCAIGMDPAYEGKIEDWELMVETNINGLLYCTHAVLSSMVKRNSGHIIHLGSVASNYSYPGGNIYGATKAFVHRFSLNLRADLLGKNVRVSCIEPGIVQGTEFSVVRHRGSQEKAAQTYAKTLPLNPEDIAETIFWCHQLPPHVNVNTLEVMPIMQASGPFAIHRQ